MDRGGAGGGGRERPAGPERSGGHRGGVLRGARWSNGGAALQRGAEECWRRVVEAELRLGGRRGRGDLTGNGQGRLRSGPKGWPTPDRLLTPGLLEGRAGEH